MPPALGRFSTITVWPRGLPIACAITRDTVSVWPPAAKGTIIEMFLVGYCCAAAPVANAANATATRERRFIDRLRKEVVCGAPGGIRTHDPWLRRPIL